MRAISQWSRFVSIAVTAVTVAACVGDSQSYTTAGNTAATYTLGGTVTGLTANGLDSVLWILDLSGPRLRGIGCLEHKERHDIRSPCCVWVLSPSVVAVCANGTHLRQRHGYSLKIPAAAGYGGELFPT